MTELVSADAARFENMERVALLYLKGENATAIARTTGIKRKDVLSLINEWKETAVADQASRDRAADALTAMDEHYNLLIKKLWEVVDEVDQDLQGDVTHQMVAQKTGAIKAISELEAKRVDTLQKAGLLDAADLGNELAEREEKEALLIAILQEVTAHCSQCRPEVARRLSEVTGRSETVTVQGD